MACLGSVASTWSLLLACVGKAGRVCIESVVIGHKCDSHLAWSVADQVIEAVGAQGRGDEATATVPETVAVVSLPSMMHFLAHVVVLGCSKPLFGFGFDVAHTVDLINHQTLAQ